LLFSSAVFIGACHSLARRLLASKDVVYEKVGSRLPGTGPGRQQATTGVILFMSSQDDEGRLPVVELVMNAIDERRKLLEEGDVDLALPRLREGSCFPDWLLSPRKRSEQALTAIVADMYLAGVGTRRVDRLVRTMGIEGISKSSVSRLAG
jgi:hypothetical protein